MIFPRNSVEIRELMSIQTITTEYKNMFVIAIDNNLYTLVQLCYLQGISYVNLGVKEAEHMKL